MNAGIYIHVPFCAVKCPYCDFYSKRYSRETAARYTDAVCRNLAVLPEQLKADTVYFGGGTPSLLSAEQLGTMLDAVQKRCNLASDAEITLEANPLTMTAERLYEWRALGINRISAGVQSFQPDVLRQLGRKHTPAQARDAVLCAYDAGFRNISIDLMTGLAVQTETVWQADLELAVSLPIRHISAYMLKIEENTPFYDDSPAISDADEMADRYMQMHRFLTENGFLHYEISNFAKEGAESRHNRKYWALAPYYGIGPAAHSCHDGKRFAVPRDLEAFCAAVVQPEQITAEDAGSESERIMLGLRLSEGIALSEIPQSRENLMRCAKPLIPQYLRTDADRLCMTAEGWLVSNAVLTHLLADAP